MLFKNKVYLLVITAHLLGACTSVQIVPVNSEEFKNIHEICIINNSKVKVSDFVPVLINRLHKHKIASRVINQHDSIANCQYVLHYSAWRSWDLKLYLSKAKLDLFKKDKKIASADYSLGIFNTEFKSKYRSVEEKMNPIIDKLFGLQD